MAIITINSVPAKIVELEVAPVENTLTINDPEEFVNPKEKKHYTIKIIVGTYQFAAGKAVAAENPTYTVGESVPITLSGLKQLRLLATAQNDEFEIARHG